MKNQALFSWKGKSKKFKCCLLQFFFDTLRVKMLLDCLGEATPQSYNQETGCV